MNFNRLWLTGTQWIKPSLPMSRWMSMAIHGALDLKWNRSTSNSGSLRQLLMRRWVAVRASPGMLTHNNTVIALGFWRATLWGELWEGLWVWVNRLIEWKQEPWPRAWGGYAESPGYKSRMVQEIIWGWYCWPLKLIDHCFSMETKSFICYCISNTSRREREIFIFDLVRPLRR